MLHGHLQVRRLDCCSCWQVLVNLLGNAAHLSLSCNSRPQPFELDLTGSKLTFTVSPPGGLQPVAASSGLLTPAVLQNVDYGVQLRPYKHCLGCCCCCSRCMKGSLLPAGRPCTVLQRCAGGFFIQGCNNLTMHGPATLAYATFALGWTQARPFAGTAAGSPAGMGRALAYRERSHTSPLPTTWDRQAVLPQPQHMCCVCTQPLTRCWWLQVIMVVAIDPGYPSATLLSSGAALLAIPFNAGTGRGLVAQPVLFGCHNADTSLQQGC